MSILRLGVNPRFDWLPGVIGSNSCKIRKGKNYSNLFLMVEDLPNAWSCGYDAVTYTDIGAQFELCFGSEVDEVVDFVVDHAV